ncbi:D-galactose 1-dehydrogenase [Modicisalibacter muralis]|uniref:D-galactose 1-dehydrogenase n=1 Tax=Modicisalibacter muralis TaxID=119000 RepID=A0A1G9IRJ8_9GAMM|nr:Gfo/Idh/MocA family oxidoreductase [Halomonas muralis]SDL27613.1 D-galactose 1-dehydrogenase [Halomonas muralis]
MPPIKIGLVGLGKIARDQHLPALGNNPDFELVAVASRNASLEGVADFASLEAMLDGAPELDAVALCTPPTVRHAQARLVLARGKHVLLEKPPGATLSEVEDLTRQAEVAGRTLFATWHSRHAPGVAPAREWLAAREIQRVEIQWKEDVRVWHPGQEWLWEPGGMGVFDPGINALSIVTGILPNAFFLREATLFVPENRQAPIAANLAFSDAAGAPIEAEFDFLQSGPQTWDIHVDTDAGRLTLSKGGSQLFIDGRLEHEAPEQEYPSLYTRFAELIGESRSEVDVAPLRHVADAFLLGRREVVEAFVET